MNPDKIPPQPSPNHSSDLESRMARLVGLEEEPHSSHSASLRQPAISEPQEVQTTQSLSSNPFAKVGLVGAGTLALVVFAGAFLSQLMSGNHNKPKITATPQVRSQPTTEPRVQQQGAEIETLKTKLALAQQANDVKAAQQQLRTEKPTTPRQVAVKPTPRVVTPRPTVVVQRVPTPTRPAPPRIVTVERRVPQPEVKRTPTPQQQLPIVPQRIEPVVQATPTPQPTPDPLQEWSRLAKLGSYGQASPSDKQSLTTIAQKPLTVPRPTTINPQPSINPTPAPVVSQATQQHNPKSTVVGSSANAKLVTSVYGEVTRDNTYGGNRNIRNNSNNNTSSNNTSDNSGSKEVFVAQLTEPLKAADNSVILPKDTQLLFNVASTSEKGLMQLNVTKVSYQDKGNRVEKNVPLGSLVIRGRRGAPPLAEQRKSKEGSHFASDFQELAVGSVGQIGEEVNRPTTKLSGSGCYGTSNLTSVSPCLSETTYPRNILAAIAQGGSKAILPGLNRRSQLFTPPKSDRNNVFEIPAGKEVQVFVDQPVQL